MTRRAGQLQLLIGLAAWLVLTLLPMVHVHASQAGTAGAGGHSNWSCALCAATQAPPPDGVKSSLALPTVSWIEPLAEPTLAVEMVSVTHDGRAPPAPLV